jgi:nucleoside-diphosphate-sugar epimerase
VQAPAEVARADAFTGEGLAQALEEIEVAYYLIHSMERAAARAGAPLGGGTGGMDGRFEEREHVSAERFAQAAATAGVRRIVYLGGLLPAGAAGGTHESGGAVLSGNGARISRHLRSRARVEQMLLAAVGDSVALRASIVIGARSRSFRLLVRLIERMPALPLPAWRDYRTQPIDARDVIEMLARAASADVGGRSLDVGGPETLSYGEMVKRIADAMLVGRAAVGVGANLTPITARVAAAITREDPQLVLRLMESLNADLLPADDHAAELFGVKLHSFDAAVENALREWEQSEPLAAR